LVTGSPVILLDEPTAGLDIRHQIEIMALLQQLVSDGKIVVITTHDLSVAEYYSTQVTILKQGKCLGSGPFETLMTDDTINNLFDICKFSELKAKALRTKAFW
jgi:iron complex transport system ATP-binding protein